MRLLISRHLENFLALYNARSMRAAAEAKGISQPALTKSLRLLEEDLGTELFLRTAKGLQPTVSAQILHRYARAIDQEARFAALDVADSERTFRGRIRIGIGPVMAVSAFPDALVEFHRRFPTVEIAVETGITDQLVQALLSDGIDIAVTAVPMETLPEKYVAETVFRADMAVLAQRDHPLMGRGSVTMDALCAYERVGFVEDRFFDRVSRQALGPLEARMRPTIQTMSLSVIFSLLAATDHYAIISDMVLPRARREGLDVLPVDHELWHFDIGLLCKSSLASSRPVRTIREALIDYARRRFEP